MYELLRARLCSLSKRFMQEPLGDKKWNADFERDKRFYVSSILAVFRHVRNASPVCRKSHIATGIRHYENTIFPAPLLHQKALPNFTLSTEIGVVLNELPVSYHVCHEVFIIDGT